MTDIIDFHTHVGDFTKLREDIQELIRTHSSECNFNPEAMMSSPKDLLHYAKQEGIHRSVLIAEEGPATNYHITSEFVLEFAASVDENYFIPFGCVNPKTHEAKRRFEKALESGIRGFKLYPADHDFNPLSDEMMWFYNQMEVAGLPLMFHTGHSAQRDANPAYCAPSVFTPIARAFPKLPVVLCHAGKPDHFHEALQAVMEYPNCYVDTALVKPKALLREFRDAERLSHKIIFGSDWPAVTSLSSVVQGWQECGLSQRALQDIFHDNAERLLRPSTEVDGPVVP